MDPRELLSGQRFGLRRNWEILFVALANGSVGPGIFTCWRMRFLERKDRGFGPNQAPKMEGLKAADFGRSEKTYLVVYIRVATNRVVFYVPLLDEPRS